MTRELDLCFGVHWSSLLLSRGDYLLLLSFYEESTRLHVVQEGCLVTLAQTSLLDVEVLSLVIFPWVVAALFDAGLHA